MSTERGEQDTTWTSALDSYVASRVNIVICQPQEVPSHNPHSRTNAASSAGVGAAGGKAQRTCGVCGDKARSLHFGGLSCDSCKAFFRRAVQSSGYKNFQCPHQAADWSQYCVINVASRKSCQKCRFERCVKIGMEVSWVMSEAERQKMLTARLSKKRRHHESTHSSASSSSSPPTTPGSSSSRSSLSQDAPQPLLARDYLWPLKRDNLQLEMFLTPEEVASVHQVLDSWEAALQRLPPTPLDGVDITKGIDHALLIRSMSGSIERFSVFARPLLDASNIEEHDRKTLIQSSMLEMCIIRGALNHNHGAELYERLFPARLHEIHCRFVRGLQDLALDQTTLLIFIMVVLFSPERPGLYQASSVDKIQEHYLMLLNKYLGGRYGSSKAATLYPKLLSKMADLRELSDCHQEHNLLLAQHEVKTMKKELSRIQQPEASFNFPQQENPSSQSFFQHHLPSNTLPTTSSMMLSNNQIEKYTSSPSISSSCPQSISPTNKFFSRVPNTSESNTEDMYLAMSPFGGREQFYQNLPPYLSLGGSEIENKNEAGTPSRRQDSEFQSCCFSGQRSSDNLGDSTSYTQFYESGNNFSAEQFSLDKTVDGPFDDCHTLVEQCFNENVSSGHDIVSPNVSIGQVVSYDDFNSDFALSSSGSYLSYHQR